MSFSPDEVAAKTFTTVWRGYDPAEVEAFLRAVADDMRRAQTVVAAAPSPSPAAPDPIESVGATVSGILQAAQGSAKDIVARAEAEAAERLHDADDAARRRLEQATAEAARLLEEARREVELTRGEAAAHLDAVRAEALRVREACLRRRNQLKSVDDQVASWLMFLREEIRAVDLPAEMPLESGDAALPVQPTAAAAAGA